MHVVVQLRPGSLDMVSVSSRTRLAIKSYLKHSSKHLRVWDHIADCSSLVSLYHFFNAARVLCTLSWQIKPALCRLISRQMFTLSEMITGSLHASASATTMPKFSWSGLAANNCRHGAEKLHWIRLSTSFDCSLCRCRLGPKSETEMRARSRPVP